MTKQILEKLPNVEENVLLKDYTTFKIGGPAKHFFIAKSIDDLINALKVAKETRTPVFILGGGSNVVIPDKGLKGLVIKINITGIELNNGLVYAGAGETITKISYFAADNGLSGLEWAAGMPGSVGGAVYGNAQAFGSKTSSLVKEVKALNLKNLEVENFTNEQCQFSLKNSIFKENKNLIITSVLLELKKEEPEQIKSKIKEFLDYRKTKHPMDLPSAGSVFVNPEIEIKNEKLLQKFPELKDYNLKKLIPSGYLISKCGLSGKRIGQAQISEKHANFIVNLGGAKAKDVIKLIKLAHKEVKKVFGIKLETEIQIL